MENEHVPCDPPDYSHLIGKKPPGYSPPRRWWMFGDREARIDDGLRLESCSCGLLVLHAPCEGCRPLQSVYQSAGPPPPPTETRGNKPLVLASILFLCTVALLADSIQTLAPRTPSSALVLD